MKQKENYIPFSEDWKKEMSKLPKMVIIEIAAKTGQEKDVMFTETQISQLQNSVHKITGNGEVMQLFNLLLGVNSGGGGS